MFKEWEDCEKLKTKTEEDDISKEAIPRHFRAMINCVIFQRSHGKEFSVVTEDQDFNFFAERWNVKSIPSTELERMSTKALEKYHREMKAYETRRRTTARNSAPPQRSLWAAPK